jgi:tryptophanyl-tRNA synthetase
LQSLGRHVLAEIYGCRFEVLNRLLEPMHERRQQYQSRDMLTDILREGTQRARRVAQETMEEVREAMKIQYFK